MGVERRHRRRLATLARQLGLNYHPHDVLNLTGRYHRLTLMREGHDRRAWDVLSGPTRAGALSCFAYQYEVGFGAARAVRRWLIAVLETDHNWGRVALRGRSTDGPEKITWDAGGAGAPGREVDAGPWMVTSRSHDATAALADIPLVRLSGLLRDVRLEMRDHLVALQAPLSCAPQQMGPMVAAVQEVVELLAGGGGGGTETGGPGDGQPGHADRGVRDSTTGGQAATPQSALRNAAIGVARSGGIDARP